jgi:hypothetical protein
MLYKSHGLFTEDVNLIRSHFKDLWRTNLLALTASIAFVRINDDIPAAGPVIKTIIGYHVLSFLFFGFPD